MIDIENKEVLIRYLFDKKVINDKDGYSINYCIGGVSCIAAFIMAGDAPILIKQAREKLNVAVEWLADQERIAIESRANEIYHELVPEYAPKVIFYDPENYVLVREAAPYSWKMWKSNLLEGTLDFGVARKTMEALATVHNKTANNTKVAKDFSNYTVFEQLRISPYIDYVIQQYPELTTEITAIKEKILSRHIA
ncbi:MAG: aminoglycoside phosphotransferase, partial [Clostridiaceae bacterium]|nr:aminoglycoside phosphotransferase [Clostridiaceae bacterium]